MNIATQENKDLQQPAVEASFGEKILERYKKKYEDMRSQNVNSEDIFSELYQRDAINDPTLTADAWAKSKGMDKFLAGAKQFEVEQEQYRVDAETRQKNEEEMWAPTRGIVGGTHKTVGLLSGLGMLGASKMVPGKLGEGLASWFKDAYESQMHEASLYPTKSIMSEKDGEWFDTSQMQGPGDWLEWLGGTMGDLAPSMAFSIATGIIGGVAGGAAGTAATANPAGGVAGAAGGAATGFIGGMNRKMVERFIAKQVEKSVAKGIERGVATKLAEKTAAKYAGGAMGQFIGTNMLETGSNFAQAVDHFNQKFLQEGLDPEMAKLRAFDEASGILAVVTGSASALIERLGGVESKVLDNILGKGASEAANEVLKAARSARLNPGALGKVLNIGKGMLAQVAKTASSEFTEEALQEISSLINLDFSDPDFQIMSHENLRDVLGAGIAGAVGGGGMAVGNSAITGAKRSLGFEKQATVDSSIKDLQARIKNQENLLATNPKEFGHVASLLEQNKADLAALTGYADKEKAGLSLAEAAAQINEAVPSADGKQFGVRQLRNLIRNGRITAIEQGTVDKVSVAGFIAARKAQAAGADSAGVQNAVLKAEQAASAAPKIVSNPAQAAKAAKATSPTDQGQPGVDPEFSPPMDDAGFDDPDLGLGSVPALVDSKTVPNKEYVLSKNEFGFNTDVYTESQLSDKDSLFSVKIEEGSSQDDAVHNAVRHYIDGKSSVNLGEMSQELGIKDISAIERAVKRLKAGSLNLESESAEKSQLKSQPAAPVIQAPAGKGTAPTLKSQPAGSAPVYFRATPRKDQPVDQRPVSREALDRNIKNSMIGPISTVFEDLSELPENVRQAVEATEGTDAPAFAHEGRLYFSARHIRTAEDAVHAIGHEIIHPAEEAHTKELVKSLGLGAAKEEWGKTLDHVYRSFTKGIQKLYVERKYNKSYDIRTREGQQRMAVEFMAERHAELSKSKNPMERKWYHRVLDSMRRLYNGVRKAFNLKPIKMNDRELVDTVMKLRESFDQAMVRGGKFTGKNFGEDTGVAYSRGEEKKNTAKSVGKWTRKSVEEDKDSLYIFTDNTDRTSGSGAIDKNSAYAKKHGASKKYPMKTQAVVRGLDNAFPISTMKNFVGSVANAQKGMGQWQESDFDLFKKTIDEEIEDIKAAQERFHGGIKYSSGEQEADKKIGQGSISKLPPKLQEYLDNKLLEIGIDQNQPVNDSNDEVSPDKVMAPATFMEAVDILESRDSILSNSEAKQFGKMLGILPGEKNPVILTASETTDPVWHARKVKELVATGKYDGLYLISKHDGLPMRELLQLPIPKLIHFSVTTLGGTKWEPGVMKWNDLMDKIEDYLAQGLDPDIVTIRIDPIVPGVTDMQVVKQVMSRAKDLGIKRIRFSVMDGYSGQIEKDIRSLMGEKLMDENYSRAFNGRMEAKHSVVQEYAEKMVQLAKELGIEEVGSCAENITVKGVNKEGCLPTHAVSKILGQDVEDSKSKQRKLCSCFGGKVNALAYSDKCASSCVYCYARHGSNAANEYYNEDGTLKDNKLTKTRPKKADKNEDRKTLTDLGVESAPAGKGSISMKNTGRVLQAKKDEALPSPNMDSQFPGARETFGQEKPTVTPGIEAKKSDQITTERITFPPKDFDSAESVLGQKPASELEVVEDRAVKSEPKASRHEVLGGNQYESVLASKMESEIPERAGKTAAHPLVKYDLSEEDKALMRELAKSEKTATKDLDINLDDFESIGFPSWSERERVDPRLFAARKALLASGGIFNPGEGVLSVMDIPVSKDFKYDVFNIGDKRISLLDSYGRDFKAYWKAKNKKFESEIDNKLLTRSMPLTMRFLYLKMAFAQNGLSVMSGTLNAEKKAAIKDFIKRIKAEGIEAVNGRIPLETARRVEKLLDREGNVKEGGEADVQEEMRSRIPLNNAYRFADFIRSVLCRTGKDGLVKMLTIKLQTKFERKDKPGVFMDAVREEKVDSQARVYEIVTTAHSFVLDHMTELGVLSEKESSALSLVGNVASKFEVSTDTNYDLRSNTTAAMLENILGDLTNNRFIKTGTPLPVTGMIKGEDGRYESEIGSAVRAFLEKRSEDSALAKLSVGQFIIGIVGMGQGVSANKYQKYADARYEMIYDANALGKTMLENLRDAGFLKSVTEKEVKYLHVNPDGTKQQRVRKELSYVANDEFTGTLGEIRKSSFLRETRFPGSPRNLFFSGIKIAPNDGVLSEMREVVPGTILLNPNKKTVGVVGPFSNIDGEVEILTMSLNAGKEMAMQFIVGEDGKPKSFSFEALAKSGYVVVPRTYDMLPGMQEKTSFRFINAYDFINAESALKRRATAELIANESGLEMMHAVGFAATATIPSGQTLLVAANSSGDTVVLEAISEENVASINLDGRQAAIVDTLIGRLSSKPFMSDPNPYNAELFKADAFAEINALKKIGMFTADDAALARRLVNRAMVSADAINSDKSDSLAGTYRNAVKKLNSLGIIDEAEYSEHQDILDVMNASMELDSAKKPSRMEDEENVDVEESGAAGLVSMELVNERSETDVLRGLLGLDGELTVAEQLALLEERRASLTRLALNLVNMSKMNVDVPSHLLNGMFSDKFVRSLTGLGSKKTALRMLRAARSLSLAIEAIKKKGIGVIVESAAPEDVKTKALKIASNTLALESVESTSSMSVLDECYDIVASLELTGRDFRPIRFVDERATGKFKKDLAAKIQEIINGSEFGVSISSLLKSKEPTRRAIGLHLLSKMAEKPLLFANIGAGLEDSIIINAAYARALQDTMIPLRDGKSVRLGDMSVHEQAMIRKLMSRGGLYQQILNAYLTPIPAEGQDWKDVKRPKEPVIWPRFGTPVYEEMLAAAKKRRIRYNGKYFSILDISSFLDVQEADGKGKAYPKSAVADKINLELLVMRLARGEIPADAGAALSGLAASERPEFFGKEAYRSTRGDMSLRNVGNIHLAEREFGETLIQALKDGDLPVTRDGELELLFDEEVIEDEKDNEEGAPRRYKYTLNLDQVSYSDVIEAGIDMFELHGERFVLIPSERELTPEEEMERPYKHGLITGADVQILKELSEIDSDVYSFDDRKNSGGRAPIIKFNGEEIPVDYRDSTITSFGLGLLEKLKAYHEDSMTNLSIPEKMRVAIRRAIVKWSRLAQQYGKGIEQRLQDIGKFRQIHGKQKYHLREMEAEEAAATQLVVEAMVEKALRGLTSVPESEIPAIVIHDVTETADMLVKTTAGRNSLPTEILAGLRSKGMAKATMKKLRGAMGFVGSDGAIHIFPGMHANASGDIDRLEVLRTVFHEVVGHVALSKVLGAEYESFMLSVFEKHAKDRSGMLAFTKEAKILAAEEFLASMIERVTYSEEAGRFTNEHIGTILDKIGSMIMRAFRAMAAKFGYKVEISRVEVRDLLSRAFAGSMVKSTGFGFFGPGMIPAENLPGYEDFGEYRANMADRFLRTVADKIRPWDLLFRSKELSSQVVADEQNFMYWARTMKGRIGYLTGLSAGLEKKFVEAMKGISVNQKTVGNILLALHTIERNAVVGPKYAETVADYLVVNKKIELDESEVAKGITAHDKAKQYADKIRKQIAAGTWNGATGWSTLQAKAFLGRAARAGIFEVNEDGSFSGEAAKAVSVVLEASKMALSVSEQAGMVSTEKAAAFRAQFKYFVPVAGKGVFGWEEEEGFRLQGRGRFQGSLDDGLPPELNDETIPDIIGRTFANLRHRIVEGEQNNVYSSIVRFAAENPNSGVFNLFSRDENGEWKSIDGESLGKLVAGAHSVNGSITQEQYQEFERNHGLIPAYKNGKVVYLRIVHDGLRQSMSKFMNPKKMGWAMRQLAMVNRWLISVNTSFNPEFMLPNLFKDFGAAMNTLAMQQVVAGIEGKTGAEFAKEFSTRVAPTMKVLYARNFGKSMEGFGESASLVAKYIEEFESSGAKIQWPFSESAADTMKNLEEQIALAKGKGTAMQKAKAAGSKMADFMKNVSGVFENATRLAAYATARENGASIERAALLARDITVDFDRKGDIGESLNALYLFANAGLQGSLVIARAIRRNPKRAAKHLGGIVALSFAVALVNILAGGNDDDDEPAYFSVPESNRNTGIVIMLPFTDGGSIRIPLPYGYSAFWAIGQEAANALLGRKSTLQASASSVAAFVSNFNPLETAAGLGDAHGFFRLAAPTVVDPFVDIAFEQTAFGTPLMPEATYEGQPDSQRHWRSVSAAGKFAAQGLNELFGGSGGKSSGITDLSPETLDLLYENVAGGTGKFLARTLQLPGREDISANDIPIARRFSGGSLSWEARGRFKANYDEIQGVNKTYKNLMDNVSMAKDPELRARSIDDLADFKRENSHILGLKSRANDVVSRVKDLDKQKERLYKSGRPEAEIRPQLRVLDERQLTVFNSFNRKFYEVIDQ